MRKPSLYHFTLGYIAVWALALMFVVWWLQDQQVPVILLAASTVNIGFVIVNIIGVAFAANGSVPWRDQP